MYLYLENIHHVINQSMFLLANLLEDTRVATRRDQNTNLVRAWLEMVTNFFVLRLLHQLPAALRSCRNEQQYHISNRMKPKESPETHLKVCEYIHSYQQPELGKILDCPMRLLQIIYHSNTISIYLHTQLTNIYNLTVSDSILKRRHTTVSSNIQLSLSTQVSPQSKVSPKEHLNTTRTYTFKVLNVFISKHKLLTTLSSKAINGHKQTTSFGKSYILLDTTSSSHHTQAASSCPTTPRERRVRMTRHLHQRIQIQQTNQEQKVPFTTSPLNTNYNSTQLIHNSILSPHKLYTETDIHRKPIHIITKSHTLYATLISSQRTTHLQIKQQDQTPQESAVQVEDQQTLQVINLYKIVCPTPHITLYINKQINQILSDQHIPTNNFKARGSTIEIGDSSTGNRIVIEIDKPREDCQSNNTNNNMAPRGRGSSST